MFSASSSPRVQAVSILNMPDVLHALPPRTFNTSQRRSRAKMDEGINLLPQAEYDLLLGASQSKKRRRETATSSTSGDGSPSSAESREDFFFESVSDQCRRERVTKFIDATGSDALASAICVVCAGSFCVLRLIRSRFVFCATQTDCLLHSRTPNTFSLMVCCFTAIENVTIPMLPACLARQFARLVLLLFENSKHRP